MRGVAHQIRGGQCTIGCIICHEAYTKLGSFLVCNCTPGILGSCRVFYVPPFFSTVAQELGCGGQKRKLNQSNQIDQISISGQSRQSLHPISSSTRALNLVTHRAQDSMVVSLRSARNEHNLRESAVKQRRNSRPRLVHGCFASPA